PMYESDSGLNQSRAGAGSSGEKAVDEPRDFLRMLFVEEQLRVRDRVETRDVRELGDHFAGPRLGKGGVVRSPDEQRRHRELAVEVLELVEPRELHPPEEPHGAVHASVRGDQRVDEARAEIAVDAARVVEAAAEREGGSTEGGGLEELPNDGAASGEVRQCLIHRDPGRAVEGDLGVGEDEV